MLAVATQQAINAALALLVDETISIPASRRIISLPMEDPIIAIINVAAPRPASAGTSREIAT